MVEVVLLLRDWSPVLVVLSIVRLDRPRRSISGVKVDVDPVTLDVEFAEDPLIDEFTLELEPVTDGLVDARAVVELALAVLAAEGAALVADAVPEVAPAACSSGMQSMCTGLEECSFALPVSLPASLPAFGWPSELHSGLELAVAPGPALVAAFWASAGVAAKAAARASALRCRDWIMVLPPVG